MIQKAACCTKQGPRDQRACRILRLSRGGDDKGPVNRVKDLPCQSLATPKLSLISASPFPTARRTHFGCPLELEANLPLMPTPGHGSSQSFSGRAWGAQVLGGVKCGGGWGQNGSVPQGVAGQRSKQDSRIVD